MALNKYSYQSDAVVDLYRAALYLARGSGEIGIQFLIKAKEKLGERLDPKINSLISDKRKYLKNAENYSYWAEKILDQYHRLKYARVYS